MKRTGLLFILLLVIASCSNDKKPSVHSRVPGKKATAGGNEDFYRRYSGTIAGQPVIMHLERIGNKFSGSYYYLNQGKYINLYNTEDTTNDNDQLFTEVPFGAYDGNYAHWNVQFSGNELKGTWTSADGEKEYPVLLTEQYPEGSYRIGVKYYEASRSLIEGREAPSAVTSTTYLVPGEGLTDSDAAFIRSVVANILGCDTIPGNTEDCIHKMAADYLQDYRDGLADMDTTEIESPMNDYSAEQEIKICYNDNGILMLEDFNSGYTGGAHGNYASGYICADVRAHRVWKLSDIMTVDSSLLKPLLQIAARDYFKIAPGDDMDGRMLVDEVPVTDNFFISEKGISFVYNPYEIASYADGTVALFISYNRLRSLLKPAFMKRMHLFTVKTGAA